MKFIRKYIWVIGSAVFIFPLLLLKLNTSYNFSPQHINGPIITKATHPVYAADFANDKILIGGSHNVFIGKVIEQAGTSTGAVGPETEFSVQVISNIKGNLQATVIVRQIGGYKDGVLYMVEGGPQEGDVVGPANDGSDYMLQPGNTYLFATRYNADHNWHTLNSFSTARETISTNSALNTAQLQSLAARDARVQELQAAYPKEVLLVADISHSNTLNSYQSLSEQQKAALPYYTAPPPPPPPAPAPTSTPPIAPPPPAPAPTSTASSTGM